MRFVPVSRPLLLVALCLSILAFYLVINNLLSYRATGRWLYAIVALLLSAALWPRYQGRLPAARHRRLAILDLLIFIGGLPARLANVTSVPATSWS